MRTSDKLKAAREAFAAYERALQTAQDVVKDGPPTGLGTTVMSERDRFGASYVIRFECSECKKAVNNPEIPGWKFCPHCGAEIIRWQRMGEPQTITAHVEESPRAEPGTVVVHIDSAKGRETASKKPRHLWP